MTVQQVTGSMVNKTLIENIGAKRIIGSNLLTKGKFPFWVFWIEEIQNLAVWEGTTRESTSTTWLGGLGYAVAGNTATRDGLLPFKGQKYFNTDTNVAEIWNGTVWGTDPNTDPQVIPARYEFPLADSVLRSGNYFALAEDGSFKMPDITNDANSLVAGQQVVINVLRGVTATLDSQGVETFIGIDGVATTSMPLVAGGEYRAVLREDNKFEIFFEDELMLSLGDYAFSTEALTSSILAPAVPEKYKYYLVDASGGEIQVELPPVTVGSINWYVFTLVANTHHCEISVDGGQLIAGEALLSISTVNASVIIKSNGVDGYDVIADSRSRYIQNTVTADLDLSEGFESGALYICNPPDSTEITITVENADNIHLGNWAKFVKGSGVNSVVRVKSVDESFNEIITGNSEGFELAVGVGSHLLTQDSRAGESALRINFYPTTDASVIEPTYAGTLISSIPVQSLLTTPPISTTDINNPQSIGFFINDSKALVGLVGAKPITAVGQIKKTSNFTRDAKIKFKYYEYDFGTNTLNPVELAETSYSADITEFTINEEVTVTTTLPENTWAEGVTGKLLVIELLAIKVGSGGADSDPTLDFTFGGSTPSLSFIDVSAASVSHSSLGGVSPAQKGISDGHITDQLQTIAGHKIFADGAVVGMQASEFFALAEKRIRDNAGSGFAEWGKVNSSTGIISINEGMYETLIANQLYMGRTLNGTGTSRTNNPLSNVNGVQQELAFVNWTTKDLGAQIAFPPAPDGTKTYDSATGAVVTHVDSATAFTAETATIKVITSRQDFVFLESFHEKISDKDVVYPLGNVQYGASTWEGIALSNTLVDQDYSVFGAWDTATTGYGVVWSTLSDADKIKFLQDPENNIYNDDGELIQVRYRVRVVEGLGDDWGNVDPQFVASYIGYHTLGSGYIQPRGQETTTVDLGNALYCGFGSTIATKQPKGLGYFTLRDAGSNDGKAHNGLCFAIPIALVQRRNQGAYHPVYNPEGTKFSTDVPLGAQRGWYDALVTYTSTTETFTILPASPSGAIQNGASGRSDSKFYDAIYASDVKDLRMSSKLLPLEKIREKYKRMAIAGEVRGFEGVPFTKVFASVGAVTPEYTIVNQDNPAAVVAQKPQLHSQANPTWTDIIGDPARIAATFPNGVEGQWIPVIPDGAIDTFPLNRKSTVSNDGAREITSDDGASWTSNTGVNFNSVSNSANYTNLASNTVSLLHYETQAHFTSDDVNSEVLDLGGVNGSSLFSFDKGVYGEVLLNSSLIGKINTAAGQSGLPITRTSKNLSGFTLDNGKLYNGTESSGKIEHGVIDLSNKNNSPAVKTLDYLSAEDGVGKLCYAYKEMVYDVDWGDNNQFEIIDNQSTQTDDNGNTVLYGTASFDTQYFIVEE